MKNVSISMFMHVHSEEACSKKECRRKNVGPSGAWTHPLPKAFFSFVENCIYKLSMFIFRHRYPKTTCSMLALDFLINECLDQVGVFGREYFCQCLCGRKPR